MVLDNSTVSFSLPLSLTNKKVRQTEACRTEKYKAPICRYTKLIYLEQVRKVEPAFLPRMIKIHTRPK